MNGIFLYGYNILLIVKYVVMRTIEGSKVPP
jgi:hypothetical protein